MKSLYDDLMEFRLNNSLYSNVINWKYRGSILTKD